jgi:hypothetical protein
LEPIRVIKMSAPMRKSPMIPSPPKPRYLPGTRVRVVQHVRVGHRRWTTEVVGTVSGEGSRPVGGMEMGSKGLYCQQPTLELRREDGEVTSVALDENTEVHALPDAAGP